MKEQKTKDLAIGIFEGSAMEKAEKQNKSNTKPVYLVVVENPFSPTKNDLLLSQKIDKSGTFFIEVTGTIITKKQLDEIETIEDTWKLLENDQTNDCYPWNRVKCIRNIGFKLKQNKEIL